MTGTVDVVVVGAGTTGLALACGLAAGGVSVRVLDRAAGPATTSRALGLQPRGAEVIDRLGALGDLPARSLGIARIAVHINGRHAASLRVGQRTKLVTRPGLLVSQAEIEAGLRDRLGDLGVRVEWGRELVGARQDASGVTVEVADSTERPQDAMSVQQVSATAPEQAKAPSTGAGARPGGQVLRAGWLVGCDGAHSRVRKLAGIGFPGVPLVERFQLADVHADLPIPRDGVAVWLKGEQMLGAFPLPGVDLWRLMAPVPPQPAADRSDDVLGTLTDLLHGQPGCASTTVKAVAWTSTFRVHRRLADTYRTGRLLLAGDAAHIHSPFGGQGMNTGLGDAENLAWKLALVVRGRAGDALVDTYEAERRPIATEVLSSTSAMTQLLLGDNPLARWVRDHVFVPLLDRPFVQRSIWEQASQLKVSYRGGPLGDPAPLALRWMTAGRRPRIGDRMPDLACVRTDGTRTRLHAELGGRWAFLPPTAGASDPYEAVAFERFGKGIVTVLERLDGQAQPGMLVRPDGHLAWRSDSASGTMDAWVSRFLETGRS